jgi:hypothetical protein
MPWVDRIVDRDLIVSLEMKTAIAALLILVSTGCIVVGGYSSGRGWFIWPGTFVIFAVALILFLLFRRRA